MVHAKVRTHITSTGHGSVHRLSPAEIAVLNAKPKPDAIPNPEPVGNVVRVGKFYSAEKGCWVTKTITDTVLNGLLKRHWKELSIRWRPKAVELRRKITVNEQLSEEERSFLHTLVHYLTVMLPAIKKWRAEHPQIQDPEAQKQRKTIGDALVALYLGRLTVEQLGTLFSEEQLRSFTTAIEKALSGRIKDKTQIPLLALRCLKDVSRAVITDFLESIGVNGNHKAYNQLYSESRQESLLAELSYSAEIFSLLLGEELRDQPKVIQPNQLLELTSAIAPKVLDGGSTSVRALHGGLPSLGKGR